MKTRGEIVSALNEFEVRTQWRQKSQWRRKNHAWLRHSGFIALRVLERLEELGLSQKEISWNVGLSSSTVSEYTRKLRRKIGYSKPGDWDLLFKSFLTNLSGDFYGYKS